MARCTPNAMQVKVRKLFLNKKITKQPANFVANIDYHDEIVCNKVTYKAMMRGQVDNLWPDWVGAG